MITTTRGEMDEAMLEKRSGVIDNENEHTTWVEYWDGEELVHRSAHIALKKPLPFDLTTGLVGG